MLYTIIGVDLINLNPIKFATFITSWSGPLIFGNKFSAEIPLMSLLLDYSKPPLTLNPALDFMHHKINLETIISHLV